MITVHHGTNPLSCGEAAPKRLVWGLSLIGESVTILAAGRFLTAA
jgi:hypothetical protein